MKIWSSSVLLAKPIIKYLEDSLCGFTRIVEYSLSNSLPETFQSYQREKKERGKKVTFKMQPTATGISLLYLNFPGGSWTNPCGFDPWVGKIPWRREWQPTLGFLPGKSCDRGAWLATVHGVTKSQTRLSDWALSTVTESGDTTERKVPCLGFFFPNETWTKEGRDRKEWGNARIFKNNYSTTIS